MHFFGIPTFIHNNRQNINNLKKENTSSDGEMKMWKYYRSGAGNFGECRTGNSVVAGEVEVEGRFPLFTREFQILCDSQKNFALRKGI